MNTPTYDTNYAYGEFKVHGESQLHDRLIEAGITFNTIFDVGANIGEWKRMVRERHGSADIHCFEPIPATFRKLILNNVLDDKMMINPFGLSDGTGLIDMVYDEGNDRLTSAVLDLPRHNPVIRPVMVMAGDKYCKMHGIDHIGYLKIDTEGHEMHVLSGLEDMVKECKIDVIQFEYGYANILTKDLLIDFYRLLRPLGYMLGKLTPNGVIYKEYDWYDEDFRGPDYVVVSPLRADIVNATQVHQSN